MSTAPTPGRGGNTGVVVTTTRGLSSALLPSAGAVEIAAPDAAAGASGSDGGNDGVSGSTGAWVPAVAVLCSLLALVAVYVTVTRRRMRQRSSSLPPASSVGPNVTGMHENPMYLASPVAHLGVGGGGSPTPLSTTNNSKGAAARGSGHLSPPPSSSLPSSQYEYLPPAIMPPQDTTTGPVYGVVGGTTMDKSLGADYLDPSPYSPNEVNEAGDSGAPGGGHYAVIGKDGNPYEEYAGAYSGLASNHATHQDDHTYSEAEEAAAPASDDPYPYSGLAYGGHVASSRVAVNSGYAEVSASGAYTSLNTAHAIHNENAYYCNPRVVSGEEGAYSAVGAAAGAYDTFRSGSEAAAALSSTSQRRILPTGLPMPLLNAGAAGPEYAAEYSQVSDPEISVGSHSLYTATPGGADYSTPLFYTPGDSKG